MKGPALADHDLGLDEGAGALLEEERVALCPLDEERLEGGEVGRVTQEGVEQLLGARRGEGVQAHLRVVGPAGPAVVILRPVVDEEEDPRAPQAVHESVEEGLRLGVDPVEILEHQQERPHPALPDEDPPHAVQRGLPALLGIEHRPRRIVHRHVEQPQHRRHHVAKRGVERGQAGGHLRLDVGADRRGRRSGRTCAAGRATGIQAVIWPYETEPVSSTIQPRVRDERTSSWKSRDFPTPGSPTTATT